MSAWAEWKAGMITDNEYSYICREEDMRDRDAMYASEEEYEDEDEEE